MSRRKAGILRKLGLQRVVDVLFFFPRDYEDFSEIQDIAHLQDGEAVCVIGQVADFELANLRGGRTGFYLLVEQNGRFVRAVWFNQPYRANKIEVGRNVMLAGKVKLNGQRFEMMHPRMTILEEDLPSQGTILPVYSLTEGIKQPELRKFVRELMDECLDQVEEIFPDHFLQHKEMLGIQTALKQVHFPESTEEIETARKRFVFQELLMLQLAVQLRKSIVQQQQSAPVLENSSLIDARIKKYFPYELTASQQKSIREIAADMGRAVPMNRMLHGDVGCGKTSVAVYALLLAVAKWTSRSVDGAHGNTGPPTLSEFANQPGDHPSLRGAGDRELGQKRKA